MNAEREKIFKKIKKCLALSKSSNQHEAAAALRQARALMDKHGFTASNGDIFTISESRVKSSYKRLPRWLIGVGSVVCRAFGCSQYTFGEEMVFVGPDGAPEVAAYAYAVLQRTIKRDKVNYLQAVKTPYHQKSDMAALGRAFCEGWCTGVFNVVKDFANPVSKDEIATHQNYLTQKCGARLKLQRAGKSSINKKTMRAAQAGHAAGVKVQIFRGVGEGEKTKILAAEV